MAGHDIEANDAAVRCRQRVRPDIPDQGWLRHRRVRPAIRPASRLLCRHIAEVLIATLDATYRLAYMTNRSGPRGASAIVACAGWNATDADCSGHAWAIVWAGRPIS